MDSSTVKKREPPLFSDNTKQSSHRKVMKMSHIMFIATVPAIMLSGCSQSISSAIDEYEQISKELISLLDSIDSKDGLRAHESEILSLLEELCALAATIEENKDDLSTEEKIALYDRYRSYQKEVTKALITRHFSPEITVKIEDLSKTHLPLCIVLQTGDIIKFAEMVTEMTPDEIIENENTLAALLEKINERTNAIEEAPIYFVSENEGSVPLPEDLQILMNANMRAQIILVEVTSHMIMGEPRGLYDGFGPNRWLDKAPRLKKALKPHSILSLE